MLGQLVTGMNEVRESLSGLVSRADLKDLVQQQRQEMHTYVAAVEDKVSKEIEEVKATTTSKDEFSEMKAKLEAQFEKLGAGGVFRPRVDWAKDALDPMYRSIGTFGWDAGDKKEFRKESLDTFMKTHFKDIAYAINYKYKFPRKDGKLKGQCHLTFITRDEADEVLRRIRDGKFEIKNGKNANLTFDKPKTSMQEKRWYHVRAAEELLKKDARTKGQKVEIDKKMPIRKVLVNNKVAFEQEKDDVVGVFVGDFQDLRLDLEASRA